MDKVYVVQQKLPAKPRIWKKPWGPIFLFFGHDVQSVSEEDELTGASVKPAKASSCLFSRDLSRIAFRDRLATLSSNVRTGCVQDVAVDPFRVGPKRFPPQYLEEVVARTALLRGTPFSMQLQQGDHNSSECLPCCLRRRGCRVGT